jgi:two-component system phosphate regulon response regulator PhoB/two-component system alkaline phosphatase synthesis response regulator PhoP
MSKLVAIVDDEQDIVELVALHVKKNGFEAKGFTEPAAFFRFLKHCIPDVIILDLMLPDTDGFEICKQLKQDSRVAAVPIIMLTAKADETDKVLGLELGADDYITKPFSPKELVARVKVALRRKAGAKNDVSSVEGIFIDPEKFEVRINGKKIDLTTTEFKILELLCSKKGYVFSRERLLDHLWGEDKAVLDRTIDVHIRNLRAKLGSSGNLIKNVRGVGYKVDQ